MKRFFFLIAILAFSCQKELTHEKYVFNASPVDTLTIINPDFDTVYTVLPNSEAMIYAFKVLDTKQEMEDCKWLGKELYILNQDDSVCTKDPRIEDNWQWTITTVNKERFQKCTFTVVEDNFNF